MVGLSVLLESHENSMFFNRGRRRWTKTGQIVVNQTAAMKNRPSTTSDFVVGANERDFLHQCFLCKRRLLENEDIYIYMGEMAFCSEDCRLEYMNVESKGGAAGQQREEDERGERSRQQNVEKESQFLADASPPGHEGKKRYKSRAKGGIAC